MKFAAIFLAILLSGCATEPETVWRHADSSADFETDLGQCRAQAFGVANVTLMQAVAVQNNCLRGKGWRRAPR